MLNYFTKLNSRGASTEEEREDQLAKITQGALALNADVIGIVEVRHVLAIGDGVGSFFPNPERTDLKRTRQ